MKIKTISGIVLMLLFASMLTLTSDNQVAKADVIIVPDDYPTIQAAINAANPGDSIQVRAGTYYENVVVNKSVSLIGYDPATTIIDGGDAGNVVEVVANDVFIANFTMRNGGYYWSHSGLYLNGCNNTEIRNNNITGNSHGVYFDYSSNNTIVENNITGNDNYGIYFDYSSGNTIEDNNITENWLGLFAYVSSSNNISENNVVDNHYYGVYLYYSSNNKLRNNNISDSWYNFGVYSWSLSELINDIDTSNMVNGKPIYYWINEHDISVPLDAGYIALVNCTHITAQNLNLTNNEQGILLAYTTNSTITQNNITNNDIGMYTIFSSSNNISENKITNNWAGIYTEYSSNNNIVENNLTYNYYHGIYMSSSSNNKLRNNNISDNWYNFGVYGWDLSHYVNDIDTSNTVNSKTVYYWINEHDMSVPSDAGYIALINCSRISVQNLNLTNNYQGILLVYTTNSTITQNNIKNNSDGIRVSSSSNNTISGNNITNSGNYGVMIENSLDNNIVRNRVTENWAGIYLYSSLDNKIVGNNATDNYYYGVYIGYSSNNILCKNNIANNYYGVYLSWWCSNNSIVANNVTGSSYYGVYIDESNDNIFYYNNFNNTWQVYSDSTNIWDGGYPFGGNYWSDYIGVDSFNGPAQDVFGSDGIGDTQYSITTDNPDNYPLMAPFNIFDAGIWNGTTQNVEVNSNSTVSDFQLDTMQKTIKFNVTGLDSTHGFCRITIPNIIAQEFWHSDYNILLNGESYPFTNWTDAQNTYIYIYYRHSEHEIIIVPEFSSTTFLALLMIASMLAMVHVKRKASRKKIN